MQTNLGRLLLAWLLAMLTLLPAVARAETAVQAWVQRYNGPGNSYDNATALAVDGSNNVIVTGYSRGSTEDFATIKYSSAGVPLWTNRFLGRCNGSDGAYAIAVDASNNVIVAGRSSALDGFGDWATIKYSSEGMPLWTNYYNGPGNTFDAALAMAVDGSNAVIVTYSLALPSAYEYPATMTLLLPSTVTASA